MQGRARQDGGATNAAAGGLPAGTDWQEELPGVVESGPSESPQCQFFDYAGPLFAVVVSPAASTTPINEIRKFRALPRDRSRRRVVDDLTFGWDLVEGEGSLQGVTDHEVEYRAPGVPGLARLTVTVRQRDVTVTVEALITVTDNLESAKTTPAVVNTPGYTFERAAGELWRCRFDAERNIIVVNSGHRDFVFATRSRAHRAERLLQTAIASLRLHAAPWKTLGATRCGSVTL